MKKIIGAFLVWFVAGGFHAIAEDASSSITNTDGVNTQPVAKETTVAKPKAKIKENLFYGGYINLSFGDYKVIGIEPMLGYKLTPKLSAGIKLQYNYIQDDRSAKSRTTSTYGGSIFGRYLVTPTFYAQAEAANTNYEFFSFPSGSEREWVPFLFLGGGYIQPLGERAWLNVQILFDVLQDDKSPYDDWEPFFSIGVGAGF